MAKISELPDIAQPTGDETVVLVAGGVTRRARAEKLFAVVGAAAPRIAGFDGTIIDDMAGRLGGGPALYVPRTYAFRRGSTATAGAVLLANPEAAEMTGHVKIALPDTTAEKAVIFRGDTGTVEAVAYNAATPKADIVEVIATVWRGAVHSRYAVRTWREATVASQCWYGHTVIDLPRQFGVPAYRTETDPAVLALGLTQSYSPGVGLAAYAGDDLPIGSAGKTALFACVMTSDTGTFAAAPVVHFYDANGAEVGAFNPGLRRTLSGKVRRYTGRIAIPARAVYYLIGMDGVAGTRLGVTGIQHHVLSDARPLAFIDQYDFPAPPAHRGTIILLTVGQSNGCGAGGVGVSQTVDRQDPRILQQITSTLGPELAGGITPASWRSDGGSIVITNDAGVAVLTATGADQSNPNAVVRIAGLTANTKHRVLMRVECVSGKPAILRDNPNTAGKIQYPSTASARLFDFDITPAGATTDIALIGNNMGGTVTFPAGTVWRVSDVSVRAYGGAGTAIVPATEPMRWPNYDVDYGAYGTSPVYHMARRLLERDPDLRRIVILPCNQPGQGLTTGPWAAPNGPLHLNAVAQLTAALARYPGAHVVIYIANGEADALAGTTQAAFVAAETDVINRLRAIKGAENAVCVQVTMPTEWVSDPAAPAANTRKDIDAGHRQMPQQVRRLLLVNGVSGYALAAAGTDNLIHYGRDGARLNGRNAADAVAGAL